MALDLNDAILDALAEARAHLDDPQAPIRWVARANLHLTLRFLGEVPEEMIPAVCQAATLAAGQVNSFDFHIRGLLPGPPEVSEGTDGPGMRAESPALAAG